ncbi:HIT family protein [Fodinibius sp. AD559]|uniref:HIT family protein n=1 Tax=Fodinibius sp. AD559 TaxID=3424179 RepID=UPI004046A022
MFDFNDAQRNELMQLGTHTAELVIDLFDADSFNWTIQDRPPAGQTVPHFHLHIIPRIE